MQEACPMWVPLVENNEYDKEGADYFIKKNLDNLLSKSKDIDTILLACTHYPLLMDKLVKNVPEGDQDPFAGRNRCRKPGEISSEPSGNRRDGVQKQAEQIVLYY